MLCRSTDIVNGACHEGVCWVVEVELMCTYCWHYVEEIILFYTTGAVLFCQ